MQLSLILTIAAGAHAIGPIHGNNVAIGGAQHAEFELVQELKAWKSSKSGQVAYANGFHPKSDSIQSENAVTVEELKRFKASKELVAQLSKDYPNTQFTVDNQFALLDSSEFAKYVQRSHSDSNGPVVSTDGNTSLRGLEAIANGVDWMTSGCVAPIKDQGYCGSCWAFSGVAMAEYANCNRTGKLELFSEQQINSCATENSDGCDGGFKGDTMDWISDNGICTSKDYPYISGTTKKTEDCKPKDFCNRQDIKLSHYKSIPIGEDNLTGALNDRPVSVSVFAGNDVWKHYNGGVVPSCPDSDHTDHAVFAVGYGSNDDYVPYYKIKNSWGTTWGEDGFINLQRGVGGKGTCLVAWKAMYATTA